MDAHHWMGQALLLAEQAALEGEVPVGAILVRGDQAVGSGYNRTIGSHDPTGHAEIHALRDAATRLGNYRLPDTTLYVTLEPCTMCFGALVHARVARLVYAASEPRAGVCGSRLCLPDETFYNHRVEVSAGVGADAAGDLLRSFFRRRR